MLFPDKRFYLILCNPQGDTVGTWKGIDWITFQCIFFFALGLAPMSNCEVKTNLLQCSTGFQSRTDRLQAPRVNSCVMPAD